MLSAFGETVTYLRASHRGPEIINSENVIPEDEDEIDAFMRGEINKYNKLKR